MLFRSLEHRAILESLDEIADLAPGLYEMKIDNPTDDPDCRKPGFRVRFEERDVADIRFDYPKASFERARALSEINEALYRSTISPWIRAMANPWSAATLEWLHPMRTSRYLASEAFMPWMGFVATAARVIEKDRHSTASENPWRVQEEEFSKGISQALSERRRVRDSVLERTFDALFGSATVGWDLWKDSPLGLRRDGPSSPGCERTARPAAEGPMSSRRSQTRKLAVVPAQPARAAAWRN